ncbi:preprotein translocase subunit YajC [Streptomyces armeniacus]|uniref:Preprotein translocase subunit YajC n=1 Tax=Streptomyces armeniacus TaxID=83291 RepID=A0A345XL56_9ACTN|nr:preprotein translocase subunit YajC [Streptomyces armeniacus]AXK32372.1 preprotein translocase subunit YajC [Streptomyces armeniacus]
MNIVTLLPFIVLIGAMFLMTRSAKKKQQKAAQMRDQMQPGTGVRTIGGMYATVKEIRDDAVLLEVAPGMHALYAKNAIGAVLEEDEFDRIINGEPVDLKSDDAPIVPDDVSELTAADEEAAGDGKIDLGKSPAADADRAEAEDHEDEDDEHDEDETDVRADAKTDADAEDETDGAKDDEAAEPKNAKRRGGSGSK